MENFELFNQRFQPETENQSNEKSEQLGGEESERKTFFEKVFKSKTARMLAILAALEIGGKSFPEKREEFYKPAVKRESVEKNKLELGELERKFLSQTEIFNPENRYVIHIAQTHCGADLEESRRGAEMIGKDLNYLIEKQKDIENLLIMFLKKYQIKDVFVEGVDKTIIGFIEQIKSGIIQNQDGTKKRPPERWNEAINLYNFSKDYQEGLTDQQRAYLLCLAQNAIKNEREELSKAYRNYQTKTGDVEEEYIALFNSWQEEGKSFDDIMANLGRQEKEMGDNELLKDGRVYLWGGAMKLYLEGKINAHPAETLEANQEAFAKYPGGAITFTREQLNNPKELERFRKIIEERRIIDEKQNNIREDAAMNLIAQSPDFKSRRFFPLVYGRGHSFKDNVEKFNEQSQDDVGLMRIEPKP